MPNNVLMAPEEAEIPVGAENPLRGKAESIPSTAAIEAEKAGGRILFVSEHLSLRLPLRPKRMEVRDGYRQVVDEGHVIQFERGMYWADDTQLIKHHRSGDTDVCFSEAEFLRQYVEKNANSGVRMVTGNEEAEAVSDSDQVLTVIDILSEFDANVLRERLFDSAEITAHNLGRATKDTLIMTAMRLRKAIPQDMLDSAVLPNI